MSPYEAGWRDGYNGRKRASTDPAYATGYADGCRDFGKCSRILAGYVAGVIM